MRQVTVTDTLASGSQLPRFELTAPLATRREAWHKPISCLASSKQYRVHGPQLPAKPVAVEGSEMGIELLDMQRRPYT